MTKEWKMNWDYLSYDQQHWTKTHLVVEEKKTQCMLLEPTMAVIAVSVDDEEDAFDDFQYC